MGTHYKDKPTPKERKRPDERIHSDPPAMDERIHGDLEDELDLALYQFFDSAETEPSRKRLRIDWLLDQQAFLFGVSPYQAVCKSRIFLGDML